MLNCLWIVTVSAKRMLINALFSFLSWEVYVIFTTWSFRNSVLWNYLRVSYLYEKLSHGDFSNFQCIESSKATGVPSPTISMAQRTALRLLVNSQLKQVTFIRLWFRQNSGLFSFGLDRSLRDQARKYSTWATSYSGQSATGLHKTSVFWQ